MFTLTSTAAGCRTSRVGGGPLETFLLSAVELGQEARKHEHSLSNEFLIAEIIMPLVNE